MWLEHASCSNIPAVTTTFVPQPGGKLGRKWQTLGKSCVSSQQCVLVGVHFSLSDRKKKQVGLAEFAVGADNPGYPQGV